MKKEFKDSQNKLLNKQLSTGDKLLTVFKENFFTEGKEEIDKMRCDFSSIKDKSQSHHQISSLRKTIRQK